MRDNSVAKATGWAAGVRFPAGTRDSVYFTASRPALELIQPPIEWVPGALSPG
jgi:hypothetical protein